jgi:hypothetical protein
MPVLLVLSPHLAERIRRLAVLVRVGLVVLTRLEMSGDVHVLVRKEGVDPVLDLVGPGVRLVDLHTWSPDVRWRTWWKLAMSPSSTAVPSSSSRAEEASQSASSIRP